MLHLGVVHLAVGADRRVGPDVAVHDARPSRDCNRPADSGSDDLCALLDDHTAVDGAGAVHLAFDAGFDALQQEAIGRLGVNLARIDLLSAVAAMIIKSVFFGARC